MIFISYSRNDGEFVKKLAGDLKLANQEVWWDKADIQAGDDWVRKIPDAIRSSDYVIVVVSLNSIKSEWVEKEYTEALRLHKRIIPIQLEQCDNPFALNTINPIDFQGEQEYKKNFNKLLAALKYKLDPPGITPAKPKPSLPASLRKYILPLSIILIALVLIFIWKSFLNQPAAPAPTATLHATTIPTNILVSVPAQVMITYDDGKKTSYECRTSTPPAVLINKEKVKLEISANLPDETLEKLEWSWFVSGSKEKFGVGKTASYAPSGGGIILVTLDDANICTLNIQ